MTFVDAYEDVADRQMTDTMRFIYINLFVVRLDICTLIVKHDYFIIIHYNIIYSEKNIEYIAWVLGKPIVSCSGTY